MPTSDTELTPSNHSRSTVQNIFFGPEGLRPGWGLLLFIAIVAALIISVGSLIHMFHSSGTKDHSVSLTETFVNEGLLALAAVLATWILAKIEHRPFTTYGLGGSRKVSNFMIGLATGLPLLALLVLFLWKAGYLVIEGRTLFGSGIAFYGVAWLLGFLLISFAEEFLVRGYVLYTLARGISSLYSSIFKAHNPNALGFWTAAIFWSFFFGAIHGANPGESPIGLICAGCASLLFCFSLWRTGSLWWAIGIHTAWDYTQSFLFGVGDSGTYMRQHLLGTHPVGRLVLSGGTTGPEGSLFVLPTMLLILVVFVLTVPRSNSSYLPEQR